MKKTFYTLPFAALIFGLALAASAQSAHAQATTTATSSVSIHIAKHQCNENINSVSDFEDLEEGRSAVSAFANVLANCPVTGLSGDEPTSGSVSASRSTFNFNVENTQGQDYDLDDADFMQDVICEDDINTDIDGTGGISSDTCYDQSHYVIDDIDIQDGNQLIEITETQAGEGRRFGAVRFTPNAVSANTDANALVSVNESLGRVRLNLANDTNGEVMLHVYNFVEEDDDNGNGTTTPPRGDRDNRKRQVILRQIESLESHIRAIQQRIDRLNEELDELED
ncbi:MAG: hypothetical protein V4526_03045 [Patescibacteria group bacterium]